MRVFDCEYNRECWYVETCIFCKNRKWYSLKNDGPFQPMTCSNCGEQSVRHRMSDGYEAVFVVEEIVE
jgi:hypothetical protein